jgi:hypothetical protein
VRSAPDGTPWVGSGDGADFHVLDQNSFRAQDEQSFAGKIIHIDRSGHGLPGHPFCPPGAGRRVARRSHHRRRASRSRN